jgi:two-component system chemotaxis response regulator CheY
MPITRTSEEPSFPLDFSAISFLIVDDQPFARRIVRSMLVGFGSREVYESSNGAEALELARAVIPNVIITDLIMPVANGAKLIAMLKAPDSPVRQIPIVVLSGYLTKTAALAITNSGADEVLVKPVSPKALYGHISRIVLRKNQTNVPTSFLNNQRRRAESDGKKAKNLAYVG